MRLAGSLRGLLRRPVALSLNSLSNGAASVVCTPKRASSTGSVSDEQDVIIIGGGAVGTSLAYHLADRFPRVLLLEKTELTAGSTWHAAGLTTYFNPGVNLKKVHRYSLELYKTLEAETGQEVGLHQCGSLRLATTEQRWQELLYQQSRHGWHPAPQWVVDKEEVQRLWPILNTDSIYCGLYNPGDGHIDPYSLTQALATGARARGARFMQNTPVTGTEQRADGGWRVQTPSGDFGSRMVVNAAGFHVREVGKLAGLDLPIVPVHHQYVIFKPQEETKALKEEPPVIRDLDASCYVRLERGGLLVGVYELQNLMKLCDDWYDAGPPPGFGKELFQGDLERISGHLETLMQRVPCLEHAEVQTVVSGPITYSPDMLPMIGPVHGIRNYWLAGALSYGIIHAGGMGKYLSDWMADGEPPYDLNEVDPGRYSDYGTKSYVLAKCRESYGMNNAPSFLKEERPAGRPARPLTPVYPLLQAAGAQFGFSAGYETAKWFALPGDEAGYAPSFTRTNWFEPVQREAKAVMSAAGVTDVSPFAKFLVSGPQAAEYIDFMFANKVPKTGRTALSHLLSPRGRVYSEHTVSALPAPLPGTNTQGFLCVTGGGVELHDLRWMEEYRLKGGYDVTIQNVSHSYLGVGVAGPKSRDVLQPLTDADLSDEAFPYMSVRCISVAGVPCVAVRISYTGELGWELFYEPCSQLYEAIVDSGARHGLVHFGSYAMDALRIEKGFRMWGREISMDYGPVDTGIMPFVKAKKKVQFVGQSAVQEQLARGAERAVAHVVVDTTDADPDGSETVWSGDQVIGHVTSGCFSPTLQQSLAMVDIPVDMCTAGTSVQVEILGKKLAARVLPGPPVLTHQARSKQ